MIKWFNVFQLRLNEFIYIFQVECMTHLYLTLQLFHFFYYKKFTELIFITDIQSVRLKNKIFSIVFWKIIIDFLYIESGIWIGLNIFCFYGWFLSSILGFENFIHFFDQNKLGEFRLMNKIQLRIEWLYWGGLFF